MKTAKLLRKNKHHCSKEQRKDVSSHLLLLLRVMYNYVCIHECRCPQKPEEGMRSPGVVGSCEPCRHGLELNLGSLQEQHMLLTTHPPFQSPTFIVINIIY